MCWRSQYSAVAPTKPTSSHLAPVASWLTTVHQADCSTQPTPHQPGIKATSTLAPRRAIKVLAGTAELFVGAITDLDITYEQPNLSFATIMSADGLYELSRTALTAFDTSITTDIRTSVRDP
jgi:hypothetical protein